MDAIVVGIKAKDKEGFVQEYIATVSELIDNAKNTDINYAKVTGSTIGANAISGFAGYPGFYSNTE